MDTERTPAFTPELLMLLGLFDALRKHFGPEACKDQWVGRLRRQSGAREIPASVSVLPSSRLDVLAFLAAEKAAGAVLALHCRACGRCDLSEK